MRPQPPTNSDEHERIAWPVSPGLVGVLLGLVAIAFTMPGGYDAGLYYLRPWYEQTTTPIYVHWLLAPLAWLPWPAAWAALIVVTVLAVRFAAWAWGHRWAVPMLSMPLLWTVWLGQIEALSVMGAALGWLVVRGRLHPAWFGLAAVALMTKFQVGAGLTLLFAYWLWRDRGWRSLIWAAGFGVGLAALTLLVQPDWVGLWLERLRVLDPGSRFFSSSVFPWGWAAVPLALLPIAAGRARRARMIAAATLLASPYFAVYHCTTLLTLDDRPLVTLWSWLPLVPMLLADDQTTGWLIPLGVLLLDAFHLLRERRST